MKKYFIFLIVGFVCGVAYFFLRSTISGEAAIWGGAYFVQFLPAGLADSLSGILLAGIPYALTFGFILMIFYKIFIAPKKKYSNVSLLCHYFSLCLGIYIAYAWLLFWMLTAAFSHFNAL